MARSYASTARPYSRVRSLGSRLASARAVQCRARYSVGVRIARVEGDCPFESQSRRLELPLTTGRRQLEQVVEGGWRRRLPEACRARQVQERVAQRQEWNVQPGHRLGGSKLLPDARTGRLAGPQRQRPRVVEIGQEGRCHPRQTRECHGQGSQSSSRLQSNALGHTARCCALASAAPPLASGRLGTLDGRAHMNAGRHDQAAHHPGQRPSHGRVEREQVGRRPGSECAKQLASSDDGSPGPRLAPAR